MTSLADQTETELGGRWSILVRQKRDHVRLDELLDQLQSVSGDAQDAVMTEVCRLVFPHAFAEESVLWPELRRRLPDGHDLTLQVEQEHQEVNELVVSLEDPSLERTAREEIIARLVTVLREDVRDEEDMLLPRLQSVVDTRRLRQLGLMWEAVRRVAPTRPHPAISRRPPGNALAALPLTLLDRSRDALDVGARAMPALQRPLVSGSRSAASIADRVEQFAVLRRGEDPSTHRG